jgi:hypothetical protein
MGGATMAAVRADAEVHRHTRAVANSSSDLIEELDSARVRDVSDDVIRSVELDHATALLAREHLHMPCCLLKAFEVAACGVSKRTKQPPSQVVDEFHSIHRGEQKARQGWTTLSCRSLSQHGYGRVIAPVRPSPAGNGRKQ